MIEEGYVVTNIPYAVLSFLFKLVLTFFVMSFLLFSPSMSVKEGKKLWFSNWFSSGKKNLEGREKKDALGELFVSWPS